jgi:hypothetical protein
VTQLIGISLVNWHLFAKSDIRFSGNTAILGKNATGKSTLIDLVQTVMTGGSGTLYKFNRSAGEGGGRSERTLRSYCLGQTDQGVTLRPQTVTHLTLVFGGSGLIRPVTLGLCLEVAPSDEAARVVGRYVADGVAVGTDLLVEAQEGGETPITWPALRVKLRQACLEAGGQLLEHPAQSSAAKAYIREYMRVLFTGRRAPDPDRFIKAFIMALSFEDMRSVQDFVNNYLLARNDINIGELRESILRYQQIQRDIAELESKLEALKPILASIERLEDTARKEDMAVRMQRLSALMETLGEHRRLLTSRAGKRAARESLINELEGLDSDLRFAKDELESIRAQVDTQGIESQRRLLTSEMKEANRQRDEMVQALTDRHLIAARATELLASRDRLQSFGLGLGSLLGGLEAINAAGEGLVPPTWPRDPQGMDRLLAAATAQATERLGKVLDKKDEITALRVEQERAVNQAASRLAESRRGRVTLNQNVELLMEELRQAGMRPRAVCEVIDVLDESWRAAAEALLGRDRETILVDPEHAEQAVSLLRKERRRFFGCRVAIRDGLRRPAPLRSQVLLPRCCRATITRLQRSSCIGWVPFVWPNRRRS